MLRTRCKFVLYEFSIETVGQRQRRLRASNEKMICTFPKLVACLGIDSCSVAAVVERDDIRCENQFDERLISFASLSTSSPS